MKLVAFSAVLFAVLASVVAVRSSAFVPCHCGSRNDGTLNYRKPQTPHKLVSAHINAGATITLGLDLAAYSAGQAVRN